MAERPCELDQRLKRWVTLRLNFRLKGYFSCHCDMTQFMLTYSITSMFRFAWYVMDISNGILWHQKTRSRHSKCANSILLSCGIKISAVHYLPLSQSTRVTDRRTDSITTPNTALAYARAVKIGKNKV